MAKQVVILGAGLAGIWTAHKLLKNTLPKVNGLKVILVAPTTHFFWNPAGVRGVVPGEIPDDKLFYEIQPGFAKYPKGSFQYIYGKATALDTANNSVSIEHADGRVENVPYDQLVLATGSSLVSGLPFKHVGNFEQTRDAWHDLQAKVKAAKSIVVAGSGPTAVETTAEIAEAYGKSKEITMIIDTEHTLPGLLDSVRTMADGELEKLGVKLVRGARATSATPGAGGKTTVSLSTGQALMADLYLPLFGLRANTSYVPAHLVDDAGNVKLDATLRVAGLKNVWGAGDIGNVETKQGTRTELQVIHLAGNLEAVLAGTGPGTKAYVPGPKPFIFITLGKKKGTGQMGGFKVFSFLVSYAKGRTIFTEKVPAIIDGKSMLQNKI